MIEKSADQSLLVSFIEDYKVTGKLGLGREIKVGHVLGDYLTVGY